MTDPVLSIDGLTVAYRGPAGEAPAVRDLSLSLAPGESYGLVGESGSGKSSVAYAVMGALAENGRVVSGRITVGGAEVVGAGEPALRRIRGAVAAMVYQDPVGAMNPVATIGRQLVEAVRAHREVSAADAREEARAMLARVRLPDPAALLDRYPHQLSGGQLQRAVIAMALLGRPRLLLLDEPTTGLDVTVEAEVVDLIAGLSRDFGTALLYISHNLALMAQVADRLGVMYAGRLVEEGRTRELLAAPRHPYTAGLVACLPSLDDAAGAKRLPSIPGQPPSPTELPPGCAFAPRCDFAEAGRCDRGPAPAPIAAGDGRRVACVRHGEIRFAPPPLRPPRRRPEAAESRLVVDGLTKIFGRVRANDAVSFAARAGEILAVVGESGSGKSTLGRIVIGLEKATDGRALLGGVDLARLVVSKRPDRLIRAVQMVFQNPDSTLNPAHRVGHILGRAVRRLGVATDAAAIRRRVDALLELVRLGPETVDKRPQELSGGQRQRVAIARAFAGDPDVVIADEPVSALDVSVQAAVVDLLVDMQERAGTTILFISHDLALVRHVADRVLVLYRGRVVEQGPADRVFAPPFHPYTEMLLASVPAIDRDRSKVRRMPGADTPEPDAGVGCVFAHRCPRRIDGLCETTVPPTVEAGEGHRLACHIAPETLAADRRSGV